MYFVKENGVTHKVEYVNGKKVVTPPFDSDREKRNKERFDDMVSHRKCPGLQTDTTWHAGRGTLLNQLDGDEQWAKHITQQAAKRGYNVGANDVYIGQLADFPGDPKAFFKPGEGRDEVKRRVRDGGMGVDAPGMSIEAPVKEVKRKKINPKHQKRIASQYRASGEAEGMSDRELMNHVAEKHGARD